MKNILVIGGSCFIGRVLIEELQSNNEYTIYVLNRGNRPLKLLGVLEIQSDQHDKARLYKVLPSLE